MGLVFVAEHTLLGRRAAIKTLQPNVSRNLEVAERFFNEARATSAISDPGVIQIFDFGYHVDGTAYIVMELLEGETLSERISRSGRLALGDALRIARQIAGSLAAAHARDIVHRDLKPENIYLVRDAATQGGERTKILDFGICKVGMGKSVLTQAGAMIGTPMYMSPEQCRGAGEIDHRSDIYAFGCLVFHMLTGRPPFLGDTPGDLIVAHLREDAPPASLYVPELPSAIDRIVMRCMAKLPGDRYASMVELQDALGEVCAEVEGPWPVVMSDLPTMPITGGLSLASDAAVVRAPGASNATYPLWPRARSPRQPSSTADAEQRPLPLPPPLTSDTPPKRFAVTLGASRLAEPEEVTVEHVRPTADDHGLATSTPGGARTAEPEESTVKRVRPTTDDDRLATPILRRSRMDDPQEATIKRVRPTTVERRRATLTLGLSRMEDPQDATIKHVRMTTAERRRATSALGLSRMEDPQETTVKRVRPTTVERRRATLAGRKASFGVRLWRAVLSYIVVLGLLATMLGGDIATEASSALETTPVGLPPPVPVEPLPVNQAIELAPPASVEATPANEAIVPPAVPVEPSPTNEAIELTMPVFATARELTPAVDGGPGSSPAVNLARPGPDTSHKIKKVTAKVGPELPPSQVVIIQRTRL